jgi:hypothetical protein
MAAAAAYWGEPVAAGMLSGVGALPLRAGERDWPEVLAVKLQ